MICKKTLVIMFCAVLTGCATVGGSTESTVVSKVDNQMEEMLPPYNGKRARVAVSNFEWSIGGSKTTIGIGGTDFSFSNSEQSAHAAALKDMLTTALVQSKRYRVLERAKVDSLKSEVALQEDGYTDDTGIERGQIKGTDIVVIAAVTGWAPATSGKSGGLLAGALLGKRTAGLLGAVTGSVKKSSMSMDIRIVDVRTSEVLAATSVQTEATDRSFGGALAAFTGSGALRGGLGSYSNTPMEKVIRSSILEATRFIAEETPSEYMIY